MSLERTPPRSHRRVRWAYRSSLRCRAHLALLLNERGLTGIAAEIGTHRGAFASNLLMLWDGRQLLCIDPWETGLAGYRDFVGRDREQDYEAAVKMLCPFGDRKTIIKATSEAAAKVVVDGSLDFVYIDGNHAEEYVRQDIALWWPKVKDGGILAGHDILGCCKEVDRGIQAAVSSHAAACGVGVYMVPDAVNEDEPWSWYCVKG